MYHTRDELTKNHRDPGQLQSGFMPENPTDCLCPLHSFRLYLEHLHPENPYLWQIPNAHPKDPYDTVWYTKAHIGKNPLSTFMSSISEMCNLLKIYTNHTIRVTGATILERKGYSNEQIMSVTRHKSVQSLSIYQRIMPKDRLSTGKTLFEPMTKKENEIKSVNTQDQPAASVTPPQ